MFADANVESLEPIQPDIIGVSSAIPSSQIEAIPERYYIYFTIYLITN